MVGSESEVSGEHVIVVIAADGLVVWRFCSQVCHLREKPGIKAILDISLKITSLLLVVKLWKLL